MGQGKFLLFSVLSLFSLFIKEGHGYQSCTWNFKGNPDDCGSYFQCNFGFQLLRLCPPGLHWNSAQNTCDWAQKAGCQKITEDEDVFDDNFLTEGVPSIKGLRGPQTNRNSQKSGCNSVGEGNFSPHPSDCSAYYVCSQGKVVMMKCSGGLHWNSKINTCDWPATAGCTTDSTTATTAAPPVTGDGIVGPEVTPTPGGVTTEKPDVGSPSPPEGVVVGPPAPVDSSSGYKVICYFTNWAWYRQDKGKFMPKDIDPSLCTHIVYAFALLDTDNWGLRPADTWADFDNKFYEQVTDFKKSGTKVTLALGGWNDSAGDKYSELIRDPAKRASFVQSAVSFIKKYNFDGLDLDWEYPGCPQGDCSQGSTLDKVNFAKFVKELRRAMPNAILSAAVSCNMNVIDKGYDVAVMSKYLDWIGVMTYDIHGSWEKQTGHVSPLYYHNDDNKDYLNTDYALNHWISKGADPQKIILGVPAYGQTFTLANKTRNGLNSPTSGPGKAGLYSRQAGILAYFEICTQEWSRVVEDPEDSMGPYLIRDDQWVGYDDVKSVQKKINYIKNEGLGGAMVWALDFDDFKNYCGGGKYPLISTLAKGLAGKNEPVSWFSKT